MACKYLSEPAQRPYCYAYHRLMTPSVYELHTFCHGDPNACLIYQEKERLKDKPSEEVSIPRNSATKELIKAV
jgi:hypothetical protein